MRKLTTIFCQFNKGFYCRSLLDVKWAVPKFVFPYGKRHIATLQNVIEKITTQVGGQTVWNPDDYNRSHLLGILPSSQEELPPRRLLDSYDEVLIPLGDDEILRDKYLTYMGGVRFGRILEDMDIFAAWVSYKYVLNPKQDPGGQSPFCIVTALVDQIDMVKRQIKANENIRISGNVSWVGKTSMESTLKLHQMRNGQWQELIKARFVMVARDPLNRGSAFVNPVLLETPVEKAMFEEGEVNNQRRKQLASESLLKLPPTEEERALIHEMFLSTLDHKAHSFSVRVKPDNAEWMENAKLKNVIICHPQERNRLNKIFGGFIMRQAFELGWTNAYVYSKARPFIVHVDDIWFRKPVEIGSLLYLSSQVVYTDNPQLQVRVNASVVDPLTNSWDTTNVFHFTFTTDGNVPIRQIVPKSYSEAMLYLDGKRHYDEATGQISNLKQ